MVQCVAVGYNVLQCVAVCCIALHICVCLISHVSHTNEMSHVPHTKEMRHVPHTNQICQCVVMWGISLLQA